MISVLIETMNDEPALARTLAALVEGAVEGVVREVIVCDGGSGDHSRALADEAGCVWLEAGGIAAGIARAKGDWLLLLEPGAILARGWVEDAMVHCSRSQMAARFARSRHAQRPLLSRLLGRNRALAEGLLIRKSQAASLAQTVKSGEAIARGLASKRLAAEIVPADRDR
ncbi:MAG: glycosyltransferase [Mesorhizobium sp.]